MLQLPEAFSREPSTATDNIVLTAFIILLSRILGARVVWDGENEFNPNAREPYPGFYTFPKQLPNEDEVFPDCYYVSSGFDARFLPAILNDVAVNNKAFTTQHRLLRFWLRQCANYLVKRRILLLDES